MDEQNIGSQIANQRKAHALTQTQLADQLHVTRQAVSNWERGETQPDQHALAMMQQQLGFNFDNKGVAKMDKFNEAIGLGWALALFVGILVTVLLVFFSGFALAKIILAVIIGILVFFILGFVINLYVVMKKKR